MKIPGPHGLLSAVEGSTRQALLRAYGVNGISAELPFNNPEEQWRLYFARGTGASTGLFDPYYDTYGALIWQLTGVRVIDVKLHEGGLPCRLTAVKNAVDFIEEDYSKSPGGPALVGGQSLGALGALEAAMRFDWLLGAIPMVPPTHGSVISHPAIWGSLGQYGPRHPATVDFCARLESWMQTQPDVLLLYAAVDGLIWPPSSVCIEGAKNVGVKLANHLTVPFHPRAVAEVVKFIARLNRIHEQYERRNLATRPWSGSSPSPTVVSHRSAA